MNKLIFITVFHISDKSLINKWRSMEIKKSRINTLEKRFVIKHRTVNLNKIDLCTR